VRITRFGTQVCSSNPAHSDTVFSTCRANGQFWEETFLILPLSHNARGRLQQPRSQTISLSPSITETTRPCLRFCASGTLLAPVARKFCPGFWGLRDEFRCFNSLSKTLAAHCISETAKAPAIVTNALRPLPARRNATTLSHTDECTVA